MQQITLNVSREKMPILKEFLQALGIKNNKPGFYPKEEKDRDLNIDQASSHPYYDWEFFRSELEYE